MVTEARDGVASGYLDGHMALELESHVYSRLLGVRVELLALAFNQIETEWVVGDE